ncbi:MAG TPA: hypothetical protein VNL71_09320 [Chloroflexota bacterium]|nr:hypothetical protein [Chloroflexota bacterium]
MAAIDPRVVRDRLLVEGETMRTAIGRYADSRAQLARTIHALQAAFGAVGRATTDMHAAVEANIAALDALFTSCNAASADEDLTAVLRTFPDSPVQ